jgi:CubicO group peptidase (beta-lactamase class C family)
MKPHLHLILKSVLCLFSDMTNKSRWQSTFLTLVGLLCLGRTIPIHADPVDDVINAQMEKHHITGLSLAIIEGGKVVRQQGYGFTDKTHNTRVTPLTLFQAASISKPVSALGALYLVESGRLSLDEDVNTKLRTWTVPQNRFTNANKVTLRLILSHTAGITSHRFVGYPIAGPFPTLPQVLNGEKPANTAAIRVVRSPGSQWKYSGDGYLVMQQMVMDVTGKPFAQFMNETVLKPLGMSSSTFSQPLPDDMVPKAAKGYGPFFGTAVKGGWRVQPELAAAGLWTTAADLARFAIGIQRSASGDSNPVISQSLTRQMLTIQQEHSGLGLFVSGSGRTLAFGHAGRNIGFDSSMRAWAYLGKGAVVMINRNDDGAVEQIVGAIRAQYQWPNRVNEKESN